MHVDLLTILRCYCGYRVKTRLSRIIPQDYERRCAILVYYNTHHQRKLLIGNKIYLSHHHGELDYSYHNIPYRLIISQSYYDISYNKYNIIYKKIYGISIIYVISNIYCLYINIYLDGYSNNCYIVSYTRALYKNIWFTIYKNISGANDIYHEFKDIIESRIKLINIKN